MVMSACVEPTPKAKLAGANLCFCTLTMACFMVLAVWLLVLWAAQQSQSRIIELTKFHSKPSNVVEVTLDHEDGQPGLPAATLRQVNPSQTFC